MIGYDLPEYVIVSGVEYPIRTDYRAALDIIAALNDPELTDEDRAAVVLGIFYEDAVPDNWQKALDRCFWFISGGEEQREQKSGPRLVDWEKDFRWIAAPINRMVGHDIRGVKMHWWTFLAYYYEIGDCTFAQIVRIRNARAKGKKLDKADREWARNNADLINIEARHTQAEEAILSEWMKGGASGGE